MPYTLGAAHPISGAGSVALSAPAGLKIAITSRPAYLGELIGEPAEVLELGRIALGNADGYLPAMGLHHLAELRYPIPDGMTKLGFSLGAGVGATVTELLGGASRPAAHDRNPAAVSRGSFSGVAPGTALTTLWTYTVPVGRLLLVAKMTAYVHRWQAPSSQGLPQAFVGVAGLDNICQAGLVSAVAGATVIDELSGRELILVAGQQVSGSVFNNDTGGMCYMRTSFAGYLFDV